MLCLLCNVPIPPSILRAVKNDSEEVKAFVKLFALGNSVDLNGSTFCAECTIKLRKTNWCIASIMGITEKLHEVQKELQNTYIFESVRIVENGFQEQGKRLEITKQILQSEGGTSKVEMEIQTERLVATRSVQTTEDLKPIKGIDISTQADFPYQIIFVNDLTGEGSFSPIEEISILKSEMEQRNIEYLEVQETPSDFLMSDSKYYLLG